MQNRRAFRQNVEMRVLLTNLPPLLRDILAEALAAEPDIALVGQDADVIVMQGSRDEAEEILHASGSARVVAVDSRGTRAIVLGDSESIALNDVSPSTIIMEIRGTA